MGLTIHSVDFFLSNKDFFKGLNFLSLGVPFVKDSYALHIKNHFSAHDLGDFVVLPSEQRGIYFFKEILKVNSLKMLDISNYEGAELVANMNLKLPPTINQKFNVIFDGGTHEHIFDNVQFWKNILALLDIGGSYIFDVPANNMIDHGFRQYSPTYFYDVCHANQPGLELNFLSLWNLHNKYGLNVLPFYQRLDKNFTDIAVSKFRKTHNPLLSLGRFTYFYMQLMASHPSALAVMGVITKRSDSSFNANVVQCIYRCSSTTYSSISLSTSRLKGLFPLAFCKRWFSKLILQGYFPIPLSMFFIRLLNDLRR